MFVLTGYYYYYCAQMLLSGSYIIYLVHKDNTLGAQN